MTTRPTAEKPTGVDRYGFTLRACYRCGGSGQYSFNLMHGSRCFGCGGTGWVHPRGKVAKAAAEYRDALRKLVQPTPDKLNPGDEITYNLDFSGRVSADALWRTVATVERLEETCGSYTVGSGDSAVTTHSYYHVVTFTDGTSVKAGGWIARRRGVKLDPAPYLAAAGIKTAQEVAR